MEAQLDGGTACGLGSSESELVLSELKSTVSIRALLVGGKSEEAQGCFAGGIPGGAEADVARCEASGGLVVLAVLDRCTEVEAREACFG